MNQAASTRQFLARDFCDGLVTGGALTGAFGLLATGMGAGVVFFLALGVGASGAQFESAFLSMGKAGLLGTAAGASLAFIGAAVRSGFSLQPRQLQTLTFMRPREKRLLSKTQLPKPSLLNGLGKIIPSLVAVAAFSYQSLVDWPSAEARPDRIDRASQQEHRQSP